MEALGINLGYLFVQIFNFLIVLVVLRAWVGGGSEWITRQDAFIGLAGDAALEIRHGGHASTSRGFVGHAATAKQDGTERPQWPSPTSPGNDYWRS